MSSGLETVAIPDIETDADSEIDQPWQVIVFDDPVNLMGYVTLVLRRVFGYSEEKAAKLMLLVHTTGKAIVWHGAREEAELHVQQLHSFQLQASMSQCN